MKRWALVFLLFCAAAICLRAQVVETATVRSFTISAGGMGSLFKPGASGFYGNSGDYIFGGGTYIDFRFSHWVQFEGEARWLRFGDLDGEEQSHYLIGPKVPIHQFGRTNVYGKAMIGLGRMTMPPSLKNIGFEVTCTALSFGGGLDYKLSRTLTLRAGDFEYQYWPKSVASETIRPFGVSVGMAYRVF
jgi:hypothetical protein